ncbi:MAG TPA: NmrA/HSCARG family protein [Microlunatus sp.]
MSDTRTIAVVGPTGATAGGLARAILSDPTDRYVCRAISRDPGSAAAQALAEQGAEVVQADLDDYDSLVRAFDGADGAFCMTNFFVTFSAEQETAQAANQARAAATVGVGHVIWSTAEDTRRWYPLDDDRMPTLPGGYKVPNWDGKGEGDRFFAEAGVPTTYLLTPFHWEAFVDGLGAPQPGPDGVRTLAMPLGEAPLPGIAAEDIGRCAYAIFQDPARYVGETLGIAADHTTGDDLAARLSEVYGEPVRYQHVPAEVFRELPFPAADLAANMFQFVAEDNGYGERRDVGLTRALNPSLAGFTEWVTATRARMPVHI